MFFTNIDDFASDAAVGLAHVTEKHSGLLPVVAGHSFGGAVWQYLLAISKVKVAAGLVLLAASPATGGGKEIMANWEAIEAPDGYKYPWSPRSQLDTPDRVRAAFFCPETDDKVITRWIEECRTTVGSARAGLRILWPLAREEDVLASLEGLDRPRDEEATRGKARKVLSIVSEGDGLVQKQVVLDNSEAYRKAIRESTDNEDASVVIMDKILPRGGHHLMMDVCWQECAGAIAEWLESSRVSVQCSPEGESQAHSR
jgi:pimeloyl-ACP methyl ester carboxylesterase